MASDDVPEMTYRHLGDSGLVVSTVGLGGNTLGARIDAATTRSVVHAALDAGVTLVDCAELYGTEPGQSEALLGEALRGRRDEVVLATKFGHPDGRVDAPAWEAHGSRSAVRRAVEGSLRRLGTDRADQWAADPPAEDALDERCGDLAAGRETGGPRVLPCAILSTGVSPCPP